MYLKKAIRGSIIVMVMTVFASIFSYLFRILLARELSVAEYGLFYAIFSFFSFFTIFIDLGMNQSVAKYAIGYKVKKNLIAVKSILLYSFLIQIMLSLLIFLAITGYVLFAPNNVLGHSNTLLIILMGIWFITLPIPTLLVNIFSTFQKYPLSNSLDLFRQFVSFTLSLLFLYFNFGARSPFMAYACINLLMLILYFPFIKSIFPEFFTLKANTQSATIIEMVKYGIYISIANLIFSILTQTDTLMLAFFKGSEAVGLYQVAMPIAALVSFLGTILTSIAFPMIAQLNSEKKLNQLEEGVSLIFKFLIILSLPIVIVLFAFSSLPIALMFGEKYLLASPVVKILIFSVFLGLLTAVNTTLLTATGFARGTAGLMSIAAITNIILNLALIPRFSITGAATATLTSSFVAFALSCYLVSKNVKFIFDFISMIKSLLSAALMLASIFLLNNFLMGQSIYIRVIISCLTAGLIYIAALFVTKSITLSEIKEFTRIAISK
jgi:O-antigen/teichoic acid export membrane protein